MAYFLWVGTGGANYGTLANWRNSDGVKSDLGPAASLPVAGDTCWKLNGNTTTGALNGDLFSTNVVNGGTYNGMANISNAAQILSNTFNGVLRISGGAYISRLNTMNGDVYVDATGYWYSSIVADSSVLNGRITFDNGATWLYSPNCPAVAPSAKVLAGNSNLGVAGTYRPRKIFGTKGKS